MTLRLSRNLFPKHHAADNTISGVISNGADWNETITLVDENGDQVTSVSADSFQFQFRCAEDETSATLTLSTSASTLTVTEGATTTITIAAPQSSLSSLEGDYVADLVSKDSVTSDLTHHAHGIVTFRTSPIAF
jgi:hypothetical protein